MAAVLSNNREATYTTGFMQNHCSLLLNPSHLLRVGGLLQATLNSRARSHCSLTSPHLHHPAPPQVECCGEGSAHSQLPEGRAAAVPQNKEPHCSQRHHRRSRCACDRVAGSWWRLMFGDCFISRTAFQAHLKGPFVLITLSGLSFAITFCCG